MENTIIVILGPNGHEYVAEYGRNTTITPTLDNACVMTEDQAERVIAVINQPRAIKRDVDDYRIEVIGRQRQLIELRRQLPVEAFA